MKVLFLSADTGGGHRASAESLANQFLIHFPDSTYDIIDVWNDAEIWPYKNFQQSYKHFSAHPEQWRILYHVTNSAPVGNMVLWHSATAGKKLVLDRISRHDPDVIVSVHPTMQYTPLLCCRELSKRKGKYIPFFTVVTDLASAHAWWFDKGVDKIYLASKAIYKLAITRGQIPREKIVMSGLPIRSDFAVQATKLGDRNSADGRSYQKETKSALGIDPFKPMVLLMGGGEGVGGLSSIANELYIALTLDGVVSTLCVVCGRNEKLRRDLKTRNWERIVQDAVDDELMNRKHKIDLASILKHTKKAPSSGMNNVNDEKKEDEKNDTVGDMRYGNDNHNDDKNSSSNTVKVIGLGYVENMAEYMVAAHVLVSKAGPGTIAEAAALGLPILLTSFLPGQEAGNVDFVLDHGFGDFVEDPMEIGQTIADWLRDNGSSSSSSNNSSTTSLLETMSRKAMAAGRPNAAGEIVLDIGQTTQKFLSK
ncbi:hypothetical protein ACA910_006009 [Epithemia clementina (nom. ined.)]